MPDTEHRRFPRITSDAVSRLRKIDPDPPVEEIEGTVRNLSMGGVFIETSTPFEKGDWLEFTIRLELMGKPRVVDAQGVVRWCQQEAPRGIGVAFTKVSSASKKKLGTVIWKRADLERHLSKPNAPEDPPPSDAEQEDSV